MATDPLEDILRQAELLSDDQLLRLSEELRRRKPLQRGSRSVLELQGLGKELWADVDADKYVAEERESWNG